jgi:hypothetical protein
MVFLFLKHPWMIIQLRAAGFRQFYSNDWQTDGWTFYHSGFASTEHAIKHYFSAQCFWFNVMFYWVVARSCMSISTVYHWDHWAVAVTSSSCSSWGRPRTAKHQAGAETKDLSGPVKPLGKHHTPSMVLSENWTPSDCKFDWKIIGTYGAIA